MIETGVLLSLWAFIILMVGTPLKCVSFNIGLTLGKIFLNLAMGFGLGVLLVNFTTFQAIIKFTGAAYMIYLALKSWNVNLQQRHL